MLTLPNIIYLHIYGIIMWLTTGVINRVIHSSTPPSQVHRRAIHVDVEVGRLMDYRLDPVGDHRTCSQDVRVGWIHIINIFNDFSGSAYLPVRLFSRPGFNDPLYLLGHAFDHFRGCKAVISYLFIELRYCGIGYIFFVVHGLQCFARG